VNPRNVRHPGRSYVAAVLPSAGWAVIPRNDRHPGRSFLTPVLTSDGGGL